MARPKYIPTDRERRVLDHVENPRYDRQIVNGLDPFMNDTAPEDMRGFYTPVEMSNLQQLKDTDRDVEARMPVKITRHYFEMAKNSPALQTLVKASPDETVNLEGEEDPASQLNYSPVEGLLHKYELALLYVISTCSAHCRFCYREDLIARKEIEHADGTVKKKGLARVKEVTDYIRAHNAAVDANGGKHPETGRPKLREILLSGGDPMVLPNSKLAAWFTALAEAGTEVIRVGTKELAFHPDRFDDAFLSMLDLFHEVYPDVAFRLMVHFNHPDELLAKDADGSYVKGENGQLQWNSSTRRAVDAVVSRGWVSVENQSPIIRGVNDDPDALRILQRTLKAAGIENHYFFGGRNIVAYKAFNVPIETAWQILNESQRGLSGVEAHARMTCVHFKGKTEVAAVTEEPIPGLPGAENGVVIFKVLRSPADARDRGKTAIVGRNPEALWFDDYADRVIIDEAGLFDYFRRPQPVPVAPAREGSTSAGAPRLTPAERRRDEEIHKHRTAAQPQG
jgi:lysine 2,3-aminomutase